MANNQEAFKKLISETVFYIDNVDLNQPENLEDFIKSIEKILYNDISASSLDNFNDGWKRGAVTTIIKLLLQASAGNPEAWNRLNIDLNLKDVNMIIKPVNAGAGANE